MRSAARAGGPAPSAVVPPAVAVSSGDVPRPPLPLTFIDLSMSLSKMRATYACPAFTAPTDSVTAGAETPPRSGLTPSCSADAGGTRRQSNRSRAQNS